MPPICQYVYTYFLANITPIFSLFDKLLTFWQFLPLNSKTQPTSVHFCPLFATFCPQHQKPSQPPPIWGLPPTAFSAKPPVVTCCFGVFLLSTPSVCSILSHPPPSSEGGFNKEIVFAPHPLAWDLKPNKKGFPFEGEGGRRMPDG